MTVINVSEELEKATEIALRDHFAGLALNGQIANTGIFDDSENARLAKVCYQLADLMLAARKAVA